MRDRSSGRAVDVMASGEKQGGAMENGEKWTVIVTRLSPIILSPLQILPFMAREREREREVVDLPYRQSTE